MPGFLVATRLQNLCGEPNQLAKVLRDKDGKEAQIPGTKNALWAGIFRHPTASFAFASASTAFAPLALDDFGVPFMAGSHIGFITLHLVG